jgi:uroporphyrinogen-III synthase
VAVGSSTRSELHELGVRVDVMPKVSAMGAMMNALAAHMKKAPEIRK